jgi:methyl-accepting chemotaxis protein
VKLLNNMRIASKITLAFSLFVLLCAGLTAWSVYQARVLAADARQLVSEDAEGLYLASSAQEAFTRLDQLAFAILAAPNAEEAGKLQERLKEEIGGEQEAVAGLKPLVKGARLKDYAAATQAVQDFLAPEQQLYNLKLAGDTAGATALLTGPIEDAFGRADEAYDALVEGQRKALTDGAADANRLATQVTWTLVLAAVLGVAGIGALAFWLVRTQITAPLGAVTGAMSRLAAGDVRTEAPGADRGDEIGQMAKALAVFRQSLIERNGLQVQTASAHEANEAKLRQTEAAFEAAGQDQAHVVEALAVALRALAEGDLTARVGIQVAPDYAALKGDFNQAIQSLEDAMRAIGENARGMTISAGEISQAADDLSRRTETQAATLEETAAAVDQITATVRRTSQGAGQANTAIASAHDEAEKSGVVVGRAISAMNAIETSSGEISQIIGVIDEIAFQTNLLALNAGVEAARAGDAGRGFAVVASEVRALAQRSANAAKEIKELIQTSTGQVSEGVSLVNQTGSALRRIVGQVESISGLVSEIAASAQEQSAALSQVNSAMNQMDHVTQQNAAMVEQSTAASHSQANDARDLATMVGRFRVTGGETAAPVERSYRMAVAGGR